MSARATHLTRDRVSLGASVASIAFLAAFVGTLSPMADRWSALPFALFAWGGFLTALVALVGARRQRALAVALVVAWLALWVLSWSEGANDAVAVVRRALLAFIAL